MARSPAEQFRDLDVQLATLTEAFRNSRAESSELKAAIARVEEKCASLATENALLRQKLDDHLKRVELWDGRLWGLIVLLVGAALSLASGLIVTLARNQP